MSNQRNKCNIIWTNKNLYMNYLKTIFIIISLTLLSGCVSPYYPNITKYENTLVVDGEITNLPGPYKVRLSRSFTFEEKIGIPVSNATVKIIDNTGLEIQLKENSDNKGEYITTDTTFRGIVGNSYKLQIKADDEIYESEFQILKKPIPIDKVYWEYIPQTNVNPRSVQLLLDTHDPDNNTHYYKWEYEETWKFWAPISVVLKPELKECYKYTTSSTFNINTTILRHNDNIERQSLLYINENTNRLYSRYSMLVKQSAISEEAYKFFDELVRFNQNQGTLFDPIPYTLVGNIKSKTNKDIPILGYFLVSGTTEKRIFIDRTELPAEYTPTSGFNDCNLRTVFVSKKLTDYRKNPTVDSLIFNGYQVYETFDPHDPGNPDKLGLNLAKPICYNCTLQGDNKVPSFWTEKK